MESVASGRFSSAQEPIGGLRRGPAMTDVAAVAGVSHQTVSRVINGHPNVREGTRLRVLAAMQQLGYRPNGAAKALATGRSQVVGVVAQASPLYGPASLLTAVELAVTDVGLAVSIASVRTLDRHSIAGAVGRLLDQRVAGLVIIAPVAAASDALDELPEGLPYIAIDGDRDRTEHLVTVDQVGGAVQATRHLLELGHETVWHVAGPEEWFDSVDRRHGWERTLDAAGAEIPPVIQADWSLAAGVRAGRMLARMSDVTAVFAANDHLALGIMSALRRAGRRVPGDVSVVGFDDIPEAAYLDPALTTVRPDFRAAAECAVSSLLQRMAPQGTTEAARRLEPTLIVRESTAPLA